MSSALRASAAQSSPLAAVDAWTPNRNFLGCAIGEATYCRGATNVEAPVRYLLRFFAICTIGALGATTAAYALVPQVAALFTASHAEAEPINLDPLPERSLIYDMSGNLVGPL